MSSSSGGASPGAMPGSAGSILPVEQGPGAASPSPVGGRASRVSHIVVDTAKKTTVNTVSNIPAILSGLICGLVIFVFCCVFSSMIFQHMPTKELEEAALSIGVGMHTLSTLVGSFVFAKLSGCKAVIAGPDINPAVFVAEATLLIVQSICPIGVNGTEVCPVGAEEKVIPTVLVGCMIASGLVAVAFLILGFFKLTGVVGFVPANVTAGFLSCIGYKVMKASIEVATGYKFKIFTPKYLIKIFGGWDKSWKLLIPGMPIGLFLYFNKRFHWFHPALAFPAMIVLPLAGYYTIMAATGNTMDSMVEQSWFYPPSSRFDFWGQFVAAYGGIIQGKVQWSALVEGIASWAVMVVIVLLDNMLKLASTETALKVDLDYNREMKVGGVASLLNTLLVGSPAYGQTKFNVLNYGFTHRTDTPLATYVCGAFCGTLFFAGAPLINLLPRFLLAGLLIFSGVGFLIENLWDARKAFGTYEFFSIWAVFVTNIIAGELSSQFGLLIAICVGFVLSAFGFTARFVKSSQTSDPITGYDYSSSAVRSAAQETKLGVLGAWYHIFPCEGFVFFGTAATLYRRFKQHVADLAKVPRCKRTKYLIFDMTKVYEADETALGTFAKIERLAKSSGIQLVWCGLTEKPSLVKRFMFHGLLAKPGGGGGGHGGHGGHGKGGGHGHGGHGGGGEVVKAGGKEVQQTYSDLDSAVKHVEDALLAHVHALAQKWLVDPAARKIYIRTMLHDSVTATSSVSDGGIGPNQLLRWAKKCVVPQGQIVLREGDDDDNLYLLYRGHVVTASEQPKQQQTVYPGAFFNEHVVLSQHAHGALHTATAVEDSVMLAISAAQRQAMQWQEPHLAYQLILQIFRQADLRQPHRRHATHKPPEDPVPAPPPRIRAMISAFAGSPAATKLEDVAFGSSSSSAATGSRRSLFTPSAASSKKLPLSSGASSSSSSSLLASAAPASSSASALLAPAPSDKQNGGSGSGGSGNGWFGGLFGSGRPESPHPATASSANGDTSDAHSAAAPTSTFSSPPAADGGNGASAGGEQTPSPSTPAAHADRTSRTANGGARRMWAMALSAAKDRDRAPGSKGVKGNWAMALSASRQHAADKKAAGSSGRIAKSPIDRKMAHTNLAVRDGNLRDLLRKAVDAERTIASAVGATVEVLSETAKQMGHGERSMTRAYTKARNKTRDRRRQLKFDVEEGAPAPAAMRKTQSAGARLSGEAPAGASSDTDDDDVYGFAPAERSLTAARHPAKTPRQRVKLDHHGEREADSMRSLSFIDADFLRGNDFKVPLTSKQREHYELIFRLNDDQHIAQEGTDAEEGRTAAAEGSGGGGDGGTEEVASTALSSSPAPAAPGQLRLTELSKYMDSLGHGVPAEELDAMMREAGVDHGDGADGAISLSNFLEFIRRTLVADLPSSKMAHIRTLFAKTAASAEQQQRERAPAAAAELLLSPPDAPVSTQGAAVGVASAGISFSTPPPSESSTPHWVSPPPPRSSGSPPIVGATPEKKPLDGSSTTTPSGGSDTLVSKAQTEWMLNELGCTLDESTFTEIFDEVDSDGDGHLLLDEFVTAIGMLKLSMLEVMDLEESFTRLRQQRLDAQKAAAAAAAAGLQDGSTSPAKGGLRLRGSRISTASPSSKHLGGSPAALLNEHCIYASDLVSTLRISEEEAEEMIFIADFKDNQAIDFTEFKQVVVNWSK